MKELLSYTGYIARWTVGLLTIPIVAFCVVAWIWGCGLDCALGALAGGLIGLFVVTVFLTYYGWTYKS